MGTMTDTMTVAQAYDAIRATHAEDDTWMRTHAELVESFAYTAPENALQFDNIADMRRQVVASGSHYFDPAAIRFFRGRTDTQMHGGRFWVESRKYVNDFLGEESPREYMVAWVSRYDRTDGYGSLSVEKVGSYDSLDKARRAARMLAEAVGGTHES